MLTHILQDEVIRATDLNRASGEVLNKASKGPVTIIRNDEAYALMRREVAGQWRKEASYAVHLAEIIWNALAHPAKMGPEFDWISAFDDGEKQELTRELMDLYRGAAHSGDWQEFDARLHEWSESGWAALSHELAEAFDSVDERVPLRKARPVNEAGN